MDFLSVKLMGGSAMRKNYRLSAQDGVHKLHVVIWEPEVEVRAVLQISHGMQEYIERYDEFANYMNRFGIVVIGHDHMGHGHTVNSDEEFGYFYRDNMSARVVRDLYHVTKAAKKRYPSLPYFLLGHSMGSFLARRYLMTYGEEIDGALIVGTGRQLPPVLCAARAIEFISEKIMGEKYRSRLIDQLAFGSYNAKIKHPKSSSDWLCTNQTILDKRSRDKYCLFKFTNNGFKTLFDTLAFIQNEKNIKRIPKSLPIFFLAGMEDPVGAYGKGVKEVYGKYLKAGMRNLSIKLYPGDRHEILLEIDREKVYEDIYEWLQPFL